jgi:hypothetical protein
VIPPGGKAQGRAEQCSFTTDRETCDPDATVIADSGDAGIDQLYGREFRPLRQAGQGEAHLKIRDDNTNAAGNRDDVAVILDAQFGVERRQAGSQF